MKERLKQATAMWQHKGHKRPEFAIQPKPGQESVWNYPRPPLLEKDSRHIIIKFNNKIIAETRNSYRVLETASPPTFYIPPNDVDILLLAENKSSSLCEWKGQANYFDYTDNDHVIHDFAWFYRNPFSEFETIRNYISFYPSKAVCFIDEEKVQAQSSAFYGGWITSEIIGPFKGDPGTEGW